VSVAGLTALGCDGRSVSSGRQDLVLITVDTLRWDAVGWSGSGIASTPTLDRLAAQGRVFTGVRAHSVVTLPSHASILSGRLPFEHGVRDNAGFVLPDDVPTLATVLSENGYACGAFVSAFPLDRRFGLGRGFETYDDEIPGRGAGRMLLAERSGRETLRRASEWWQSNADRPRFLWVHLFEPHFPYSPEEPFLSRHRDRPYYGEAEFVDVLLAPMLSAWLDRPVGKTPVVILTSDHGEGLGEHGERTHGLLAHDATLRVPFVIWGPGRVTPGRDDRSAQLVDLLPTALDLLQIAPPAGLTGRTLLDDPAEKDRGHYFEALTGYLTRGAAPLYGWLGDDLKAIDVPIPELYDLTEDPGETRNLAASQPERFRAMIRLIPEIARTVSEPDGIDAETRARLGSLGYLASAHPRPSEFGPEDDPKRHVVLDRRIEDAVQTFQDGRRQEAIDQLEAVLEAHPRIGHAYSRLAFLYAEAGRPDEGLSTLQRAVSLGIATESMEASLALGLAQSGRADAGWDLLVKREDSRDPQVQMTLGMVAAIRGDESEARTRLGTALELDPTFPQARVQRAILELRNGHVDTARMDLEAALAEDPSLADGWNALGAVRARSGDVKGGVESWERAVSIQPRLASAWLNLARAYTQLGETERAAQALTTALPLLPAEERQRILEAAKAARGGDAAAP
jgi:arylsulfatase A-like enzyme/Tfp pilus assembly protein PilF